MQKCFWLFVIISICVVSSHTVYAQSAEIDSTLLQELLLDEESFDELDSLDEGDTLPYTPWTVSAKLSARNSQMRNGTDLSNGNATADITGRISHYNGIDGSISGTRRLGTNGFYQQTSFSLGYTYPLSTTIDLSLTGFYTNYANDSINPLAGAPYSFTLSTSIDANVLYIDIDYDKFFGDYAAQYLTLSLSKFWQWESGFSFMPSFSASVTSFDVEVQRLRNLFKGTTKTKKLRGLSSIVLDFSTAYSIAPGWQVSFSPSLVRSTELGLSKRTNTWMLLAAVGVKYSYYF